MRGYGFLNVYVVVLAVSILGPTIQAQPASISNLPNNPNSGIDAAMEAYNPRKTLSARMKFKEILFITNREVDDSAEEKTRRSGSLLRLEDVFLKKPAIAVSYGRATISYPANRKKGDQNYQSISDRQNPLFDFAVVNWDIVNSPNEFQNLLTAAYPERQFLPALLYVHGLGDSFNDAAERLAQLTVDTEYSGDALLFSWPADDWNISFFPTPTDYLHTVQIERVSRIYLVHAVGELFKRSDGRINVVAHSMGTDLTVNALLLRRGLLQHAPSPNSEVIRSLVLAAPDISTREFNETMRPKLVQTKMRLVVYCSLDYALALSRIVNQSDNRLGYCETAVPPMAGVDLEVVKGGIHDFARHSYYLSAIAILENIQKTIANRPITGDPRPQDEPDSNGSVNEIRLH